VILGLLSGLRSVFYRLQLSVSDANKRASSALIQIFYLVPLQMSTLRQHIDAWLQYVSASFMLYTNKLYSKILHPVTDEDTMLQTSNTRSYTLSRSSNTRSYIILRASNTQSYITLRASNTQGYIILRSSNTRSYTCHGRVTYEVTNFHRRITHDHTRVTQQVHRYYY
jgi:hypothetical protein